jgi:predicted amino acid racemase
MNPTLTIDLDYLRTTARRLSARLRESGIDLLGVTKAVDGERPSGRRSSMAAAPASPLGAWP